MNQMQRSPGRAIVALILVGLGVLFLLGEFGIFNFWDIGRLWPFFIVVPGFVFLFFAATGSREMSSLAIPGSIITGTGLILLYQSVTGRWESWAYVWTLYPVFLGLGLMYMGNRTGSEGSYRTGRTFVTWGAVGFLVFGAFFEVFIFNGFSLGRYLLPLTLILVGAWMLLRGGFDFSSRRGGGGKPKRPAGGGQDPFAGAPVVGARGGGRPSASERLRQQIDEALAEDDEEAD